MGKLKVLIWVFIVSGWLLSGGALAQEEPDTSVYLSHHLSSGILNIETSRGLIQVSAIALKVFEVKSFPGNLPESDTSSLIIKSQNPVQTVEELPTWLLLKTEDVTVAFHKNPFYLAFVFGGDTLLKEQDGTFKLTKHESLYGLGSTDFPLKQISYSLKNDETMNNSVPVIISSKKYLLVFDPPRESYLKVGSDKMEWVHTKEAVKYYFVAGADFKDLFNQQRILLGNPKKSPRNLSCKFSRKQTSIDDLVSRFGFISIVNDSSKNWESLQSRLPAILNMGLSGHPNFVFNNQKFKFTDQELYNRWLQLASYSTVLANDNDNLRRAFFPYIYTLSAQAAIKGYPLVRPLFVEFPDDDNNFAISNEYMFGSRLLVAPVLKKGQKTRSVYLPKGTKWYYFYSNRKFPGGNEYDLPVTISDIPLFVRAGSFLPMIDTSHADSCSTQSFIIRYYMSSTDKRESFLMYEDNGNPDAIEKGEFETLMFMQKADVRGNPTFMFSKVKGYEGMPASRNIKLEIVGLQQVKKLILFRDDIEMKKKKPGKKGEGYYFDKERKLWVVEFKWGAGDVILSTKQKK